jgi:hypothetical protein
MLPPAVVQYRKARFACSSLYFLRSVKIYKESSKSKDKRGDHEA